jgi:hypothetical protein
MQKASRRLTKVIGFDMDHMSLIEIISNHPLIISGILRRPCICAFPVSEKHESGLDFDHRSLGEQLPRYRVGVMRWAYLHAQVRPFQHNVCLYDSEGYRKTIFEPLT